ncbi:MAG: hypothetical protein MI799_13270 [Desulfobacterales bacterium]|nr:hypothetical protein [Desulfobacterales bacterium]
MEKNGIIVTACLVVCGLFFTQPAFATLYSGPWAADSGSIITVENGTAAFGFYDYNNETSYYDLTNGLNIFAILGDIVTVSGLTNTLTFSLNDGVAEFGFYMKEDNGSSVTIYKEADVTMSTSGLYTLDFGGDSTLELMYAAPTELSGGSETPVPTAALLLGSGLIGLVGFRRKTDHY